MSVQSVFDIHKGRWEITLFRNLLSSEKMCEIIAR